MFKTAKRIINWTGEYKSRMYWGFLWSFLNGIFVAMPIMGAALFLDCMIKDSQGIMELSTKHVWLALGFMIAAILGRFLFSYLRAVFQESIAYEKTAGERLEIGDILKRVSLGFFDTCSGGELTGAVTSDLSLFEMYAMNMTNTVVGAYIQMAAMIICMFFFSPEVALVTLAALLLSTLFLLILSRRSEINAQPHQQANDSLIRACLEFVRGIAVSKSYGQESAAAGGIRDAFSQHRRINLKIEKDYTWPNAMHQISCKLGSAGIVLVSALLCIKGKMELSVFLMMSIFSFIIFSRQELVQNSAHTLQMLKAAMDKLDRIKSAEFIDSDGRDIELAGADIEFKNVSFSYGKRSIIKNLSFKVPQGTSLAVVGPSGSGKTTLCRLLARFYDVDEGSITVGGENIQNLSCESLLKNISMVFQNVYLFHDTVRNNICFGKKDATEEEMIDAAKRARCHDFIMALPQGYDTVIGEGGSSLSGGEKQRISIARALLKDAPIIILDEATASIDPENEHLIQQAISELTCGKTLITIAHRLKTIENADRIIVLQDGEIVQSGTHAELIGEEGVYRRFAQIRREAESWRI